MRSLSVDGKTDESDLSKSSGIRHAFKFSGPPTLPGVQWVHYGMLIHCAFVHLVHLVFGCTWHIWYIGTLLRLGYSVQPILLYKGYILLLWSDGTSVHLEHFVHVIDWRIVHSVHSVHGYIGSLVHRHKWYIWHIWFMGTLVHC